MLSKLRNMSGAQGSNGGMNRHAMANMVEMMPVAVMTCDLKDFKITYVNQATIDGWVAEATAAVG